MDFNITILYNYLYIFFCLLLGIIYASLLYFPNFIFLDKIFNIKNDLSKRTRIILFFLRTCAVFIISFFLLKPLIKYTKKNIEKPAIVLLQDNSLSMSLLPDSLFNIKNYYKILSNLEMELKNKYKLYKFSFGSQIKDTIDFSFNEKYTDISGALQTINNDFINQNISGIILFSDGIYNKGINPAFSSKDIRYPVYTILVGDTTIRKDLKIKNIIHNKTAYLNNKFPVVIEVEAKKCAGENTMLNILNPDSLIFSKEIFINSNNFSKKYIVYLNADSVGVKHFKAEVKSITNETNTVNNKRDFFINILKNKKRILIIAKSPHPDLSAFKYAIETNNNYEVKIDFINEFSDKIKKYNLIILHKLPTNKFNDKFEKIMESAINNKIPVFLVLGISTNFHELNKNNIGINFPENFNNTDEAFALFNENFNLFNINNNDIRTIENFPPLTVPFLNFNLPLNTNIMLFQKIAGIKTKKPLLFFFENNAEKFAFIMGENFWRWRLYDYEINKNHRITNELVNRIIQYLSTKEDKTRLRIYTKNNFFEDEDIIFDVELYDASYQLTTDAEIKIKIQDEKNNIFPFILTNNGETYHLNAGQFHVGNYKYKVEARQGNKTFAKHGEFSVSPVLIEAENTSANISTLYPIAKNTNAMFFTLNDIKKLSNYLLSKNTKKKYNYTVKLSDLINLKLLFFIILCIISIEWFIRKWNGAY